MTSKVVFLIKKKKRRKELKFSSIFKREFYSLSNATNQQPSTMEVEYLVMLDVNNTIESYSKLMVAKAKLQT